MSKSLPTIDNWLVTHAKGQPHKPALTFNNELWTYLELSNFVTRIALKLRTDFKVKHGDRIAYYGTNSSLEVGLFFACAKLGLIAVPLNWRLSSGELNEIITDCSPTLILCEDQFNKNIPSILQSFKCEVVDTYIFQQELESISLRQCNLNYTTDRDDPLFIVYTSGTTGFPKGAVLTQNAVLANAIISIDAHNLTSYDHILNILPLFHVGGINIQMFPSFYVGAQVTLQSVFDPDVAIDNLKYAGITTMVCVPTIISAISKKVNWDSKMFPSLRVIAIGSTDVPLELIKDSHSRGIPMIQIYGATETGPVTIYQKPDAATSTEGSIGQSGLNIQVKLMLNQHSEAPLNVPGEIWVKAPNNFSCYWNKPEDTQKAISDGWFKTGDIAVKDEENLYWFTDRLKHVIISGGENIYPAELERVLNSAPEVKECAVVGISDTKWGEIPIAIIVLNDNALKPNDILNIFTDKVAKFKRPKEVIFLDELPRNAMGKIQVERLKKLISSL
ncbi:MAG: AMP-binding protein [Paracoccaceae bacterium]|nr:AMP-binding protein [Paracoccaceae bacterium]